MLESRNRSDGMVPPLEIPLLSRSPYFLLQTSSSSVQPHPPHHAVSLLIFSQDVLQSLLHALVLASPSHKACVSFCSRGRKLFLQQAIFPLCESGLLDYSSPPSLNCCLLFSFYAEAFLFAGTRKLDSFSLRIFCYPSRLFPARMD